MNKFFVTSLVVFSSLAAVSPAEAAYLFTFASNDGVGTITTFSIDDGFVPDTSTGSSFTVGIQFQTSDDNSISASQFGTVTFSPAKASPNFVLNKVGYTGSTRLYTGTTAAPTGFVLGTFMLGSFDNNGDPLPDATLTIASDTAAVPEAATWAMMLVGFGAVGGTLRRSTRRRTVRFAV